MSPMGPTLHYPDCDGWRITHLQSVERMTPQRSIRRLVCMQDGPVTTWCGPGVADAELRRMATCHPTDIECDGTCVWQDQAEAESAVR